MIPYRGVWPPPLCTFKYQKISKGTGPGNALGVGGVWRRVRCFAQAGREKRRKRRGQQVCGPGIPNWQRAFVDAATGASARWCACAHVHRKRTASANPRVAVGPQLLRTGAPVDGLLLWRNSTGCALTDRKSLLQEGSECSLRFSVASVQC